ncbi:LAFA_0F16688g1_1 [Lachancea sp. 'fantastica']|nr:LAFA_0F16688g1_1 [Lachancea sp. 'fantastica']
MNAGMSYHNQVINDLGVSQRLGNSVLSELDYRANFKSSNPKSNNVLGSSSGDHDELRGRDRFQSTHRMNFDTMDSIDGHYAARKGSTDDANHQPNHNNPDTSDNGNTMAVPATPKRESEGVNSNSTSNKRMRDLEGRCRDSDAFIHSPVSDITRRIRRLRVRNSSQTRRINQERINSVRNTPLNPVHRHSFEPHATFAKPTFTSISRETKPGAIFSRLKKPDNANKSISSFRKGNTPNQTTSQPAVPKHTPVVAPSSVFQRLYEQSTISRSNSSQTITNSAGTKAPAVPPKKTSTMRSSQTMRNLRQEETPPLKTRMPKSKSSYVLSTEAKNSTTKLPKSTSANQIKPLWR